MKDLVDDSDELPPVLVDSHPSASDQRIDPVVSQVPDDRQKGSAQVPHRQEVDLGWNIDHANIPNPMITGVDNEDVWILIRRFNNVSHYYNPTHAKRNHWF